MSKVALAAKGGRRPYRMVRGISTLADLADGAGAAGILAQAGGKKFYCDPTNGTAGGDGLSVETANTSLLTVYNLTTSGNNDIVYFVGAATSYQPSAAFVWSNSYTHLIGLTNGLPGMGQRARIVNTAANDLLTLITFSGDGCLISNIQFFDAKDKAEDGQNVTVSGERNHFVNCFFAGMGNSTASGPFSRAGSSSLEVTGAENTFSSCTIGLDTIDRTGNNSELILSGARNRFVGCEFRSSSTAAGKFLVNIDSTTDLRDVQFEACLFFNYSSNWVTGITNAFNMDVSATVYIILRGMDNVFVGVGLGVADNLTRIYGAGPAPDAGYGIAINPTT